MLLTVSSRGATRGAARAVFLLLLLVFLPDPKKESAIIIYKYFN